MIQKNKQKDLYETSILSQESIRNEAQPHLFSVHTSYLQSVKQWGLVQNES